MDDAKIATQSNSYGTTSTTDMDFPTEKYSNFERKEDYFQVDATKLIEDEQQQNLIHSNEEQKKKLGTFFGVYIPVLANLFGVTLFLRFGFVIGHGGILLTATILVISYIALILTVLSLSAIATNGIVKGGGIYLLLSRTIGCEVGGSVGLIFYACKICSAAACIIAFEEAFVELFAPLGLPTNYWFNLLYGTVLLIFITFIALVGAKLYSKITMLIFVVIVFSILFIIISFCFQQPGAIDGFTSWNARTFVENLYPSFGIDPTTQKQLTFQTLFGVIFPALSGIMAGVNISGDLKNPGKSIPVGTLSALASSSLVYFGLLLLIGFTASKQLLSQHLGTMADVSFYPPIVLVGIMASSASAALSSVMGGAKVFGALAKDKVVPLIQIVKQEGEPRKIVLMTYVLVQLTLFIGELNIIAPLITMFYMLCLGFVNVACFILTIAGTPNWRPMFQAFGWPTALLGALACFAIMFLVNPLYAAIAFIIQLMIVGIVHFYAPMAAYGDVSQALIFHQVRKYLLRLDPRKDHVKYWRPQVLLLVNNPRSSYPLIRFCNFLKKGGLYILGHVHYLKQEGNPMITNTLAEELRTEKKNFEELIHKEKLKAFYESVACSSISEGSRALIMNGGIGAMKANMLVMGFYEPTLPPQQSKNGPRVLDLFGPLPISKEDSPLALRDYLYMMNDAIALDKSLILARHFHLMEKKYLTPSKVIEQIVRKKHKHIDIWALPNFITKREFEADITTKFMIQLGHIINQVDVFAKYHKLRIIGVAENRHKVEQEILRLKSLLQNCRVYAKAVVINVEDSSAFSKSEVYQQLARDSLPNLYQTLDLEDGQQNQQQNQQVENCIHLRAQSTEFQFQLLNDLMKEKSSSSSVLFVPLLRLENSAKANSKISKNLLEEEEYRQQYMKMITVLTEGLPPCMLVHGANEVISLDL